MIMKKLSTSFIKTFIDGGGCILLIPNKRRNAMKTNFNEETTKFLDNLNHSHRDLIEALRKIILEMKI